MKWLKSKKLAMFNAFAICILLTIFMTLLFTGKIKVVKDLFARRSYRGYKIINTSARGVQNAFRQIARKVRPAVVTIQTFASSLKLVRPDLPSFYRNLFGYTVKKNAPLSIGSGFIVDHRGYIVTNYHVIEKSTKILVRLFDGRTYKAKIIGFDSGTDLAVLKINGSRLPEVRVGNSKKIRVGDWAIAIGNPSGFTGTFTVGVISGKNRAEDTTGVFQNYIQTDAAINPGNSGGPLININGRVIGVNSWIHSASGQSSGINFAIPINTVIRYLAQIIRHGSIERNGYLGVTIQNPNEYTGKYNGIRVKNVIPGGPAQRGGIRAGDIIVAMNGIPIVSVFKYMKLIINSRVGERATFTVIRNDKRKKIIVRIVREPLNRSFLNVHVEEINPITRRRFGLLANDTGVIIKRMAKNSPLRKAGFKTGDLIFMMNNSIVKNVFRYKVLSIIYSRTGRIFIKAKRNNEIIWNYVFFKH